MSEINLIQADADALLKMEKQKTSDQEWPLPDLGGRISVPLISVNKREGFLLDVYKNKINLQKQTYQNRAKEIIILARLDFGPPHRNPDGEEVLSPHLHLYREGYGDKWAYAVPEVISVDPNNMWQILQDFMKFCNVIDPPIFKRGLFT